MRIFVSVRHRYPASLGGPGGGRIYDFIVKGLAELGQDVYYFPQEGASMPPPSGVTLVRGPVWDADVMHFRREDDFPEEARRRGKPWVVTCHTDISIWGFDRGIATDNWIYISRTLAETYGSSRYVLAGIDPSELIYSETKSDYFLFVASTKLIMQKGLEIAVSLSREMGFDLVVAGSPPDKKIVEQVAALCKENGVRYVGEVYGTQKAELFAGAKGLLFPTQLNEAFGLVIAESLMSGTPVISSNHGACPELISSDVGFVCANEDDYKYAIEHVDDISPERCRERAMSDYHYLKMAGEYIREYEKEMSL
ncbi:MAG: glycosyltransferase [Blastocatellia bacterium]|nr:glycosyltransferase [Blastocatellia bacterium]